MADFISLLASQPAQQNPFLVGFAVWFVMLFAGFLVSHVNEVRRYPGPGL